MAAEVVEMEERIRQIVADHLGVSVDDLAPEVSLTDELAADSLDLFELSVVLEEELGIHVPESALEYARTYGEVVAVITAALGRVRRAPPPRTTASKRSTGDRRRRRVA